MATVVSDLKKENSTQPSLEKIFMTVKIFSNFEAFLT